MIFSLFKNTYVVDTRQKRLGEALLMCTHNIYFRGEVRKLFLKNGFFLTNKSYDKLIYSINTIIKCGILQPVKIQLVFASIYFSEFIH